MLVVILAAGAGVMALHGQRRPVPQPSGSVGRPVPNGAGPSAYSDARSSPAFAGIDRRTHDATPLTRDEVFPKFAKDSPDDNARTPLTLVDSRLDADCAVAIWGPRLGDVLRAGGCTQVVRGAYVDKRAGYAALVTVFNLATVDDANRVVGSLRDTARAGFVIPLPKAAGFGRGFNVARGRAMGHYAVVGWVWRLDGTGDEQDKELLSLLVTVEGPDAVLARAAAAAK